MPLTNCYVSVDSYAHRMNVLEDILTLGFISLSSHLRVLEDVLSFGLISLCSQLKVIEGVLFSRFISHCSHLTSRRYSLLSGRQNLKTNVIDLFLALIVIIIPCT